MKLEELKRRLREEGLDQYFTYRFDIWGGGYIAMHIRKNANGTVSYCFTDERGNIIAEHLNLPEEQACGEIYDYAVGERTLAEWKKEQMKKMTNM